MFPEPRPAAPEGYDTWRPCMGRGGRLLVWLILLMIAAGSGLMVWHAVAVWASRLSPPPIPRLHVAWPAA